MTANAIDEWTLNAIPPGSGRYYAILHAPRESQRHLRATATLISIWSKLCFSNREIEVAQKKIEWWHQELDRETHLHPVTRELQQLCNTTSPEKDSNLTRPLNPELRQQLKDILQGYGSLLTHGSPATEQANEEFHRLTGATAATVFCQLPPDNPSARQIQNAGTLLSQLRCFRYLHMHINNGLMCLPMAELEARSIKPNQFIPGALPDKATDYLADSLHSLEADLSQCVSDFTYSDPGLRNSGGFKSVYIYLQLQLSLIKAMQKDTSNLFQPELRLTPIRNYWIAFRASRKFDRKINTLNSVG